jgi:SUN domain-containing protein 1/2
MDIETGLQSIPEVEEAALPQRKRSKSVERQPKPFSFGGALGKVFYGVFYTVSSMISLVWRSASALLYMCGRMLGAVFEAVLMGPLRWFSRAKSGHLPSLSRYIVVACTIYAAWYILRDSTIPWARFRPFAGGPYQPSNIPPANIAELAARLQQLEAAFTKISDDTARSKTRYESAAKEGNELAGKLDKIESRLVQESLRTAEVEKQAMMTTNKGLEAIKQEMEILHVQMQTQQQQSHVSTELIDEAAKAKLEALEERVGSVEGSVRQALETTKNVGKGGVGSLWRSMLGSGASHAELMIKSSDGQDVTALLAQIVDAQVNKYAKDTLARPDFALHSGGAMIIPSLTSPTFEVKPQTLRGQLVGIITGNGYAIGRPPITALHHELHNGHCWPFARSEGQLGVVLAAPTYITDVTIDHVAKEVAFDMRSAPKDMELWGMVEGRENIARVKAWQAAKAQLRKEVLARGEELDENLKEIPYPRTLPKSPQYIRVAKFTYDIHGQHNVQSFQVSQEIRDLGVDFGIVVLRVKSNWGREDFTCLYRLRVHGQRMGETPLPYPEDEIA